MPPSEIRKDARIALTGKWAKAVCITLVYLLLTFLIEYVQNKLNSSSFSLIINLAYFLISIPLIFGLTISFIKLKREQDVKVFDFIKDGFNNLGRAWGIFGHTFLRMLLPIICLVVIIILMTVLTAFSSIASLLYSSTPINPIFLTAFIILYIATLIYYVSRGLLYSLAYFIGYDNPELSTKECVLKSETLMKGNRGSYLLLMLSFIGWAILSALTFGIGMLWLAPYIQVAGICFYERIINKNN